MHHFFDTLRIVFEIAPKKRFEVFELFLSIMLYNLIGLLPPIATAGIIAVITQGSGSMLFFSFFFILFDILSWLGNIILMSRFLIIITVPLSKNSSIILSIIFLLLNVFLEGASLIPAVRMSHI